VTRAAPPALASDAAARENSRPHPRSVKTDSFQIAMTFLLLDKILMPTKIRWGEAPDEPGGYWQAMLQLAEPRNPIWPTNSRSRARDRERH